jgi:hypothetical protein
MKKSAVVASKITIQGKTGVLLITNALPCGVFPFCQLNQPKTLIAK